MLHNGDAWDNPLEDKCCSFSSPTAHTLEEIPKCDPGLVVPPKVLVKRVLCGKRLGNAA